MALALLASCVAAGLAWADAGRSGLPPGLAIGLATATAAAGTSVALRGAHGAGRASRLAVGAAAALLAFDAGHASLAARLAASDRDALRARRVESIEGGAIRLAEGRVESRRRRRFGDRVVLAELRAVDGGLPLPERIRLSLPTRAASGSGDRGRPEALLWPGERVRVGLRVALLRAPRNPGVEDRARTASRRGLAATGRLADPAWVVTLDEPASPPARGLGAAARLRERVRVALGTRLASMGDRSGLARALALGDRTALDESLTADLRALGLSHLVAVSGLHVGLAASGLAWLGLRGAARSCPGLREPFPWVAGLGAIGAGGYAWLSGAGVPVLRALLALVVIAALAHRGRTPRPLVLLTAIGGLLFVVDPPSALELGPQLSFGACLGLAIGALPVAAPRGAAGEDRKPDAGRGVRRLRHAFGIALRASLAACFGTAPVLALHGLPIAWAAPFVNLVAVPAMALCVLPASLLAAAVGALGLPGASGIAPLADGPGSPAPWLWPTEGLAQVVRVAAAGLPERPLDLEACRPAVVVAALFGLLRLRSGRSSGALLCWLVVGLLGDVPRADRAALRELPRVVFFDVGQGDAALVQGREANVLIDTGPGPPDGRGGRALRRSLLSLGVRRLDLLVVTHGDLDHRGGAARLIEHGSVSELWLPSTARGEPALETLARQARRRGVSVAWRSAGADPERRGDVALQTLWPPAGLEPRSRNAGSLVLRVDLQGQRFLFLADVDAAIERRLLRTRPGELAADHLKVAHHASRSASGRSLLDRVGARHALVSAPCRPTRGLPSRAALARIRRRVGHLWWTGRDGAVFVFPGRAGGSSEVRTWGRRRSCLAIPPAPARD